MSVEFAVVPPDPNDPWVLPVARMVYQTIYGLPDEPGQATIDAVARSSLHNHWYYRLTDASGLVAMACLETTEVQGAPGEYELMYLAVSPARQGEGFGRYMLQQMEREARQLGATALRLCATSLARAFYAKHGYTEYPHEEDYMIRILPASVPQPVLPEAGMPSGSSVARLDVAVARIIDTVEGAEILAEQAVDWYEAAHRRVAGVWSGDRSERVRTVLDALALADVSWQAAQRGLWRVVDLLQRYRNDITGGP